MTDELAYPLAPGGTRWGTGLWVFLLCIGGGALVGMLTIVVLAVVEWKTTSYLQTGQLFLLALGVAAVFGTIIGIAVGLAVVSCGAISHRLSGNRAPGIFAAIVGSCATLWLITGTSPELLVYFLIVAAAASVALPLAARAMDRREVAFENARVRSLHDVDSSETP